MPGSTCLFLWVLLLVPFAHSVEAGVDLPSWQPMLGQYAFNITTQVAMAQKYFTTGVLLTYNFDYPAARSFYEACLEVDPTCAMCSWGVAHSHGPWLNRPTVEVDQLTLGLAAARKASSLLASHRSAHSRKEQALIDTMLLRYPVNPETTSQVESYKVYSEALQHIREHDDGLAADADLMTFDAEARMDLKCDANGYHFYKSNGDDQPPTAEKGTVEISALLRSALKATNGLHVYAQHLLIHSTEMSNVEADTAVQVAAHLSRQMRPLQNQHLQHMSSHTFLRTGHYHDAVTTNIIAVQSDTTFMHHGLASYGPGHNCAFLMTSAMFGGERSVAYKYAQVLQSIYKGAPGRGDGPDGSTAWSYPMVAPLRFGDWDLVVKRDVTPPGNYSLQWPYGYSVLRHFSLAVASAHKGNLTRADHHLKILQEFIPSVAATNNAQWINLTSIANFTASAVLNHARGDVQESAELLYRAVDIEMGMPYDEPPDWLLPSRECYGKALIDAGRLREAEQTFRESLFGYSFHAEPKCGWALYGLRESLELQQRHNVTHERSQEIQNLTSQLSQAWQHADVPLSSSCLYLQVGSGARYV